MPRYYRRRRRTNYLIPFLVLISLGVVAIILIQMIGGWFAGTKGDAVFYIAEGRAKVLPFGTSEWEQSYNGGKVKLGDSVKTLDNAVGVLSFYDGTLVRFDEDTEITLVDITKDGEAQNIVMNLNRGQIWVNKPREQVMNKTDFIVNTEYASYSITGTVFNLARSESQESIKVIKGQVQVDILEDMNGKKRPIHSISVGIGQEVILDEAVMNAFLERKTPSVLKAITEEFKESNWYQWNSGEDEDPTDFPKSGSTDNSGIVDEEATGEVSLDESVDDAERSELSAPKISTPDTLDIVSEDDEFSISGTVEDGIRKIVLVEKLAGDDVGKKVILSDFDADELDFAYEISLEERNIRSGINKYEFIGIDENAKETAPAVLTIEYLTEDQEEDDANNNVVLGSLEDPEVTAVAGRDYQAGMEIEDTAFSITGTISGVDSVFVDGYQLKAFEAGDETWQYNVNVNYGNLLEGKNIFVVYGATEDGKQTANLNVEINFTGTIEEEDSSEEIASQESTEEASAEEEIPAVDGIPVN